MIRTESEGAKSASDFNLRKRYEVLRIGDDDRLIRRRSAEDDFKFVASLEEVFAIVKAAHAAIGHGGGKNFRRSKKEMVQHHTGSLLSLYFLV